MAQENWFKDWFNTPYYHLLYKHRNHDEAADFIQRMIAHLAPPPNTTMLDVACGKGRHAQQLASYGFDVTGIDLSEASIEAAQTQAHDRLHFYQHDMRRPFRINYYQYVFNFFTSFGYFNHPRDNERALDAMALGLKPGGTLLLDYLNVVPAIKNLIPTESTKHGEITFQVRREATYSHIRKYITVTDPEQPEPLHFEEQVAALRLTDFEQLMTAANLRIERVWGNYQLEAFDEANSPRLIMVAKKY